MTDAADLGVTEAATALRKRNLSSRELVEACLARIRERDGVHSHDGDPDSINAWARVYEEDALAAASTADERLAAGDAPELCGVPIGLKDLYAVAGKPLTASSGVLEEVPDRDCDAWARLSAEGMVLLGHLHTHEFACGGTTDQVGNPWALERSAGGSSGGSRRGARLPPGPRRHRHRHRRLAPHPVGGVRDVDDQADARVGLAARNRPALADVRPCRADGPHRARLRAAARGTRWVDPPRERGALRRYALSPRIADLDPDVADGFERALEALPGERVDPPAPAARLDVLGEFFDLVLTEMLPYHRRFAHRWDEYRFSNRARLEHAEQRSDDRRGVRREPERSRRGHRRLARLVRGAPDRRRRRADHPDRCALRGRGYEEPFGDLDDLSLTHYWDWTGFPVVSLPTGVGSRSGLPTSVSLVGRPGSEWDLLSWGEALQDELGTVSP